MSKKTVWEDGRDYTVNGKPVKLGDNNYQPPKEAIAYYDIVLTEFEKDEEGELSQKILSVVGTSFHVGENGVLYIRDERNKGEGGNVHTMAFANQYWKRITQID